MTLKKIQEIKQKAKEVLNSEEEPDVMEVVDLLETTILLCDRIESLEETIKELRYE